LIKIAFYIFPLSYSISISCVYSSGSFSFSTFGWNTRWLYLDKHLNKLLEGSFSSKSLFRLRAFILTDQAPARVITKKKEVGRVVAVRCACTDTFCEAVHGSVCAHSFGMGSMRRRAAHGSSCSHSFGVGSGAAHGCSCGHSFCVGCMRRVGACAYAVMAGRESKSMAPHTL
jgi:hypothetical protein